MNLLLLGGNFPEYQNDEILKNSKNGVQFAANIFQWNLIEGFRNKFKNNFFIVSAPFINSFPKYYKSIYYKGKKISNNECYIGFFNLFGFRNFSRYNNLKKNIKKFLKSREEKKVIVYSPHIPLLKAAIYLKRKNPEIEVILLLPDLPQFVTLTNKKTLLYKLLKPIDIKNFYKYSALFDKYILLTNQMNEFVNKNNKPNIVVEGIVNDQYLKECNYNINRDNKKIITYTGTLDEKYGIIDLIQAFMNIEDNNYILNICGRGDTEEFIKKSSYIDSRIKFYGQLSSEKTKKLQINSNVLVNPRKNNEEFTKYSFPSKNLEYLSTGKPVIAYKLDGIPSEYNNIFFYPKDDTIEALKDEIIKCSNLNEKELRKYYLDVKEFLKKKNIEATIKKISDFLYI